MVNHTKKNRHADGYYHVNGRRYRVLIGSRIQVYHGSAYKTNGGLVASDLIRNKWGRIVSKSKYLTAKKEKRLEKNGYYAQKGKFGYVKKTAKRRRTKGTRARKNDD
jgi:hypothetical protein